MKSSLPTATQEALFDELIKIAEASAKKPQPTNMDKAKRWLRNAAIISLGTGLGTAATDSLMKKLGPKIITLPDSQRRMLLAAPIAAAMLGGAYLEGKLGEGRRKAQL